jgi:hypothetical protein
MLSHFFNQTTNIVRRFENYKDFGQPINAVWRSKKYDFGIPDYLKTISEIWFGVRSDTYTKASIKYYTDNGELIDSQSVVISNFKWDTFSWDLFSWQVINYAKTIRKKPKLKKVVYFQIEFSNNVAGSNLSILNLIIKYIINRKVK